MIIFQFISIKQKHNQTKPLPLERAAGQQYSYLCRLRKLYERDKFLRQPIRMCAQPSLHNYVLQGTLMFLLMLYLLEVIIRIV